MDCRVAEQRGIWKHSQDLPWGRKPTATGPQVRLHLIKLQKRYKDTFEASFSSKSRHCNRCAQRTCVHSHPKCRPLQKARTPHWQLEAFSESSWCFDRELSRVLSFPASSNKQSTVEGLQTNYSRFSFTVYGPQSLFGFLSWSYFRALQWDHLPSPAWDWRDVSWGSRWSGLASLLFRGFKPFDIDLDTRYNYMEAKLCEVTIGRRYYGFTCQTTKTVPSLEVGWLLVREFVSKKRRLWRGRRIRRIRINFACCSTSKSWFLNFGMGCTWAVN